MDRDTQLAALKERLEQNFQEFHKKLDTLDREQLIMEAWTIVNTHEAYFFLTEHNHSDRELSYLLKFQNPLKVMADHWPERTDSTDDLSSILAEMAYKQDELMDYPLMTDLAALSKDGQCKYPDVDLDTALTRIAEQICLEEPHISDVIQMMYGDCYADNGDPNYILLFHRNGIADFREKELLEHNEDACHDFQQYTDDGDRLLAVAVKVTGLKKGFPVGTLYEQDYSKLSQFYEYAASHGFVEYEGQLLCDANRAAMPVGDFDAMLSTLENDRIQREAQRIMSLWERAKREDPSNRGIVIGVSSAFMALAKEDTLRKLEQRMKEKHPNENISFDFSSADGYSVKIPAKGSKQKTSIRQRLSVKPVPRAKKSPKGKTREDTR